MSKKQIFHSMLAVSLCYIAAWGADINIPKIKNTTHTNIHKAINTLSNLHLISEIKKNPNKIKQPTQPTYKEGEVIVTYKKNLKRSTINNISSSLGFKIIKNYSHIKTNSISILKSNKTTAEMIKVLKSDPNVKSVSPNYIRYLQTIPNDPDFNKLWGMENTGQTGGTNGADISASQAWEKQTGSKDVVVAVFDTGIDYTHQDLIANLWVNEKEIAGDGIDNDNNGYIDDIYGYDVAADTNGQNDGDPMDVHGHGTHVAGTIGAKGNDDYGISGVNWNVRIMALKIFPPGSGAYDSDILEAIDYVLTMKERGVNIVAINASYGGTGGDQGNPMNDAIKSLGDAGIVFCAAAGNENTDNDNTPHFPSSYNADNIISVASTDHEDTLSSFSNYGINSVDIAAPGSSIYSTMRYQLDYTSQSSDPYFNSINTMNDWEISEDSNWTTSTDNIHSADYSLTDSPNGNYLNNSFSYISAINSIDLSEIQNDNLALGFWAFIDLEDDYDFLHILFSADNGDHWTQITSFTGEHKSIDPYSVEIPRSFQTNSFLYAFAIKSDSTITKDGVYIDDIGIGVGVRTNNRYATWSGTSMATPHVTGAVALMASVHHYESVPKRIQRILENSDPLDSLNEKVVTQGRLNLDKAINYVSHNCAQEDQQFDQGSNTCKDRTVASEASPVSLPDCQRIQGSNICTEEDAVTINDSYPEQPDCNRTQGINTCIN